MKQLVSYRGIESSAQTGIETTVGELATHHLKRYLRHFASGPVVLRVRVEKDAPHADHAYRVKLRLALPTVTLAAEEEEGETIAGALKLSFAELEQQLKRHTAHLLKQDSGRRKRRGETLHRLKAAMATGTPDQAGRFRVTMNDLLAPLQRLARRELAYLHARGDLSANYPTLEDVVDEVLARAWQRIRDEPDLVPDVRMLHRILLSTLEDEVRRRRHDEGRWVSLESSRPVTLAAPPDEIDDQVFEFWQPDEKIRLEDVLPGDEEEPDETASEDELRILTGKLLGELPNRWRRAVLLAQVDDRPLAEIAELLDTTVPTVRRCLEYADAFLRARLEELGAPPASQAAKSGKPQPFEYLSSTTADESKTT